MSSNYRFIAIILAIVLVAAFILNNNISDFRTIDISSFDFSKIFGLLGSIAFISLLVERTSEIFMIDPKEKEKERLKREVQSLTKRSVLSPEEAEVKIQKATQLEVYQNERRKKVSIFAFTLGILIAMFGVRILTNLIENPESMNIVQSKFINIVDMVLTGCVIAGGSEGIHHIIKMFGSFMPGNQPQTKDF